MHPLTMTVIAAMAMRLMNSIAVSDLFSIEAMPFFADTFLMIYFSPLTAIVIACELLAPQTTLVPHTTLKPLLVLVPHTTELPQTTDWPLVLVPHTTEVPQTTEEPHTTERPHTTDEPFTKYTCPVVESYAAVGDKAAPMLEGAMAVLLRAL